MSNRSRLSGRIRPCSSGNGLGLPAQQQILAQLDAPRRARRAEHDPIVLKAQPVRKGQPDGGMPAKPEIHPPRSAVFHLQGGRKRPARERVPHAKQKAEGEAGARLLAVLERQGDRDGRLLLHGELALRRKAVQRQAVLPAVKRAAPLRQPSHVGEQDGRAVRPVARVALPDVFRAAAAERKQLRAARRNGGAQQSVVKLDHSIPPDSVPFPSPRRLRHGARPAACAACAAAVRADGQRDSSSTRCSMAVWRCM